MFKPSFGDFRDFDFIKYKNKLWVIFITSPKGVDDSNNFGLASSTDGINWKEEGIVMKPGKFGFDNKSLWAMCLTKEKNNFVIFYSAISDKGRHEQSIGKAYSKNLKEWKRNKNNPILKLEENNKYYSNEIDKDHKDYPRDKPILFRDPYAFKYKNKNYVIFASKIKNNKSPYNAGVGLAEKKGNKYNFLPQIFSPNKYKIIECPALYKINSNWLLLFCDDDIDVIRYATGKSPFGPFKESKLPLLPKSNYVGRIIKWKGKYLFYSHAISKKGKYMNSPKILELKNNRINLREYKK
jgi:sucrose-6-phosphate hydrolase SacC (GH32 family)